jgi:hypothetical protein
MVLVVNLLVVRPEEPQPEEQLRVAVDDVALSLEVEVSLVAVDLDTASRTALSWLSTSTKGHVCVVEGPDGSLCSARLLVEPAFFIPEGGPWWSTSTCGTTIVMSSVSPLKRRCLWLEWRWLRTNSANGRIRI